MYRNDVLVGWPSDAPADPHGRSTTSLLHDEGDTVLMAGQPRRPRLRSGVARGLIVDAARELFAAHGYRTTTTQQIAIKADISETLIFYHFGSKQALFAAAVVDPVISLLAETVSAWDEHHPRQMSLEELVGEWVARIYRRVAEQHDVIRPLLAVAMLEPGVLRGIDLARTIEEPLRLIAESVAAEFSRRGLRGIDVSLALRLSFLSIATSALFLPFTYNSGDDMPGSEAVVAELTEIFSRAYGAQPKEGPSARRRTQAK